MADTEPGQARPLRVFLCHASGDKPAVRDLYRRLQQDGFQPWFDEEDLLPGQDWQREIPRAVRSADVVLVCLSTRSINKEGYVQKEIKFALDAADEKPEGTIFLIPLKLEDCHVPERLSQWQWVDSFTEKGYEKLLRALRRRAETLRVSAAAAAPKGHGTDATHRSAPAPATAHGGQVTVTASTPGGTVKVNPKDRLDYVWIPPGEFLMGATKLTPRSPHSVRITKGFWLGKTPVTVAAYRRFVEATGRGMPVGPPFLGKWKHEDHPIAKVTWDDAEAYCTWAGGYQRMPNGSMPHAEADRVWRILGAIR